MAFDCFCASMKRSVNVSTTAPKRPERFTGASRRAVFSESFNSVRVSHRWRSSTTRFPMLRPIARAVTFVALRARSVACRSSLKTSGSRPLSSRDLRSLAWYTWSIAIMCRVEAAWPTAEKALPAGFAVARQGLEGRETRCFSLSSSPWLKDRDGQRQLPPRRLLASRRRLAEGKDSEWMTYKLCLI